MIRLLRDLCASLLLLLAPVAGERRQDPLPSPVRPAIELPDGPAARAFAGVQFDTRADTRAIDLYATKLAGEVGADPWRRAATWRAWRAALDAAAQGSAIEPLAHLALLALQQRRHEDAWRHFVACASSPECVAALTPYFLPGVPLASNAGAGGRDAPLPDGVILSPSLPPPSASAAPGRIDRRAMKISGLVIGKATLNLRVAFEPEGLQIDIQHVSGDAARFSVRIPAPEGLAIANEYVDWFRQDTVGEALAIEVKPGDEVHTLYGRFEPRDLRWTSQLPAALPAQLAGGALWLEVALDDPERALCEEIARSLSIDWLHLTCELAGRSAISERARGIAIDLSAQAGRAEKLAWLVSSVERFALSRPR